MSDIYLHVDGQQTGPYQPDQLRQLVAEGKASAETLAWYEGLSEWTTVDKVLAAFPAVPATAAFVPPPSAPPPVPPAKKGMHGCLLAAIIVAGAIVVLFVLSCLFGIALGPVNAGIRKAKESASMQTTRTIALAMFQYANDHHGVYPDGKTSTEVFQKLLDGKYLADPGMFYLAIPGKTKATSVTLTAANVCYDVTSGLAADSPDMVPVVFCTGYTVTYRAGTSAVPVSTASIPFPGGPRIGGIAVCYKSNQARFIANDIDGTVHLFVPLGFDPGTKTYRQLTP